MLDFSVEALASMVLRLPVILLALTLHECAHAWSADRLGDPTARHLGRITLNPLRHLDPIGTLCLLFAPIGWAKPVPVNPLNFRNPGRDDVLVSVAGPVSNLLQAVVFALLLHLPWGRWVFVDLAGPGPARTVMEAQGMQKFVWAVWIMVSLGVLLNVGLAVFNMLPFFPLDGHHIARENLRGEARETFIRIQPYGPFIIMALVAVEFLGILPVFTWPIWNLTRLLLGLLSGGTGNFHPFI